MVMNNDVRLLRLCFISTLILLLVQIIFESFDQQYGLGKNRINISKLALLNSTNLNFHSGIVLNCQIPLHYTEITPTFHWDFIKA